MAQNYLLTLLFILISVVISSIGAAFTYFFLSLAISSPLIVYTVPVLVFAALCYVCLRFSLRIGPAKDYIDAALPLSLAATLLAVGILAFPTVREAVRPHPDHAGAVVFQALRENTFPLKSVKAGQGFDDLQMLKTILAGKRIVAMGEATHGTSEFFRMKHRLTEFLVVEMGFRHFGMELSSADGRLLDDYIQGKHADPLQVLYWPWRTREVLDMLAWMRAYNAGGGPQERLTFHGIDPIYSTRDPVMAQNVTRLLKEAGPESKIALWAHNAHISNSNGRMGSYLKAEWGDVAYLLGFEFDHGAFTSRMATIHTYSIGPASPEFYAHALARLDAPLLYLDFKALSRSPALRSWLETPQSSHEFQELHAIYRLNPEWYTLHDSWAQLYDGLVFIEESTPAQTVP
ncbi:MAG: erythromycin esterase family protein [Acidobacteria bacterium]|nr:erythromycin esterase family protein [Acidobacteriota bacterium]